MSRLDSFQNNLDIFYHGLNQQFAICRTSLNGSLPRKIRRIANFVNRYSQKVEVVQCSLKNKHLSQKQMAAFQSASYQSTFLNTCRSIRECLECFSWQRNFDIPKMSKIAFP